MPAPSASQNRALTWAIPTRETASSREAGSGRPVSSWITLGDQRRALVGDPLDLPAYGGLVGQVGLEDQPERAGVGRDVLVERLDRRRDPLLVVVRRLQCGGAVGDHRVAGGLEQREVELELAREVLVEHRLGHPGALGDVVHRRRVVALRDEHLERGRQQLRAALAARQPAAAGADLVQRPAGGSQRASLPARSHAVRMTGCGAAARWCPEGTWKGGAALSRDRTEPDEECPREFSRAGRAR